MSEKQQKPTSAFRQSVPTHEAIIYLAVGIGAIAFLFHLSATPSSPVAAAPSPGADMEDKAATQAYVDFIVNSGLTLDNVQAKTGASEKQIMESIRGCMRYNASLLSRPGPLHPGIDCRDVPRDMTLFPDGRPAQYAAPAAN